MYAVIETGSKQYKVTQDDVFAIEKLEGEAGTKVSFEKVIAVGEEGGELKCGADVSSVTVDAEIVDQFRGDKLTVFKMKRRKGYRRKNGHRQNLTSVKITAINA